MTKKTNETRVGELLSQAFLKDEDFRAALRPSLVLLQQICSKSKDQLVEYRVADNFNSQIVQSYHAAKTRDLLAKEIHKRFPKIPAIFWNLTHSFDYQVVFGLNSSRTLLSRPVVKLWLGQGFSDGWQAIFDKHFPGIVIARDALAHDEDRVLGYTRAGRKSDSLLKSQSLGGFGTFITCTDGNLEKFNFDFSVHRYFELLKELELFLNEVDRVQSNLNSAKTRPAFHLK
jgi:hypothetical protein